MSIDATKKYVLYSNIWMKPGAFSLFKEVGTKKEYLLRIVRHRGFETGIKKHRLEVVIELVKEQGVDYNVSD